MGTNRAAEPASLHFSFLFLPPRIWDSFDCSVQTLYQWKSKYFGELYDFWNIFNKRDELCIIIRELLGCCSGLCHYQHHHIFDSNFGRFHEQDNLFDSIDSEASLSEFMTSRISYSKTGH